MTGQVQGESTGSYLSLERQIMQITFTFVVSLSRQSIKNFAYVRRIPNEGASHWRMEMVRSDMRQSFSPPHYHVSSYHVSML